MECAPGVINPCPTNLQGPAAHLFLTLINTLMASQCALGPEGRYPSDYGQTLQDGEEFDFIIVGSGSAGSVVANRLSEVPQWRVLVLEAGGYPTSMTEVPGLMFSLQDTDEDWQYLMEPSETCCLGLRDQKCRCPRGKVIGGSSTMNAMIYIRGNRKDYDNWAKAGNVGWDYDSVLKHFKIHEDFQDDDSGNFGKGGDLSLSRYTNKQPIRQILADAYRELGLKEYREDEPLGFLDNLMTIQQGTRQNSGKVFIDSVKDRKNLHVAIRAQVSRLLVNQQTKAVEGVEVRINNQLLKIKAGKEVVISAGAINSPQILMNSGIGPQNHLQSLGIEVVKDLPVGENFQDHIAYLGFLVNIDTTAVKLPAPLDIIDQIYDYFLHRRGRLSRIEITNFVTFANTKHDSVFPNLQVHHALILQNDRYLLPELHRCFGLPETVTATHLELNKNMSSIFIMPTLLNPKSKGKVLLRSADPFDTPLIFPNYLSDDGQEDLEVLVKGIKMMENLVQTEAFSHYKPQLVELNIPGCREYTPRTDDYWRCALRNLATSFYHPVGTCKMGPSSDPLAVVDPRLRVHGIKGIRVIDGSIMPSTTSGNTNGPILMIGEKGAALIKEDWLNGHDEL